MSRRLARTIVTGVAAGAAVVLSATTASADPFEPSSWTISPGGAYTATTDFTELTDVTAGISFTCATADGVAASEGSGTLETSVPGGTPLGDITALSFNNCVGPLGPVTATPNDLPYDINGHLFDDMATANETTGHIGPVNVHISMTGCEFDVIGHAPGAFDNASSELRVGLVGHDLPPGAAPLSPVNISGCFGLVNLDDVLTYEGDYTVSPGQTIVGNP